MYFPMDVVFQMMQSCNPNTLYFFAYKSNPIPEVKNYFPFPQEWYT